MKVRQCFSWLSCSRALGRRHRASERHSKDSRYTEMSSGLSRIVSLDLLASKAYNERKIWIFKIIVGLE